MNKRKHSAIVVNANGGVKNEVKTEKISAARLWAGSIVAALVAAVAVFAVMLQLEKNILTQYEKGVIYVAAAEIPKGQLITQDNWQEFLKMRELDKGCIPQTAIISKEQIENMLAVYDIEAGVLLTQGMFVTENTITKDMKEPVIAGFKAEDIYQVVGGTLRTGDRIHIYSVNDTGDVISVWQEVFVQQVFDSVGNAIPSGDTSTAAQRINIYLEKNNVEEFYTQLESGAIRVVKMW